MAENQDLSQTQVRLSKGTVPNPKYYQPKPTAGDEVRFFKKHVVKIIDNLKNDQKNAPPGVKGGSEQFEIGKKAKKDDTVKADIDSSAEEDEYVYESFDDILEKLDMSRGAGPVIDDFVKSKDPRFAGKDKKTRIRMALGAYYGKKNEEYMAEMGDPMSAAPATSDSPGQGDGNPTSNSREFKNETDSEPDTGEGTEVPEYRKQLEALALTSAQLYEMMSDNKDISQEDAQKIEYALTYINDIYETAATSSQDTSNEKKSTDDNTEMKPNAYSSAQGSMKSESYTRLTRALGEAREVTPALRAAQARLRDGPPKAQPKSSIFKNSESGTRDLVKHHRERYKHHKDELQNWEDAHHDLKSGNLGIPTDDHNWMRGAEDEINSHIDHHAERLTHHRERMHRYNNMLSKPYNIKEDVDQLDEISKKTATSFLDKTEPENEFVSGPVGKTGHGKGRKLAFSKLAKHSKAKVPATESADYVSPELKDIKFNNKKPVKGEKLSPDEGGITTTNDSDALDAIRTDFKKHLINKRSKGTK